MAERKVTTTMGTTVEETAVQEFKASLRGELLQPGDDGFDAARKVWNSMINKTPNLIIRCAGVADVINSVHFARTNNLLVAVRGGGRSVAGLSVCDGGMVIDLSLMKGVRVDPVARTASAEPGLTWGEFDHETQAHGLATTGGVVSHVGIAGLTLGGGFGWLMPKYGHSVDNLLSVDIVTADGQFRKASATENADLFWGVRGGGGNFGVVTSFEYRLHPVGQVLAGMVMHPLKKAKEALKFYRDYSSTAPDELNCAAAFLTSPEGVPMCAIFVCYNGPIDAGEQVVRPLREFGPPVADQIQPMPYTVLQTVLDAATPSGVRNYWKSSFLKGLSDDAIDTIVDHFGTVTSPRSIVFIEHPHGAASRVNKDETAFSHREGQYSLLIMPAWIDPGEDEIHIRWGREFLEAMQPFAVDGVYGNYLSEDEEGRVKAAYGTTTYQRLVTLKNKYDPTNLFRLNQNIKPTV